MTASLNAWIRSLRSYDEHKKGGLAKNQNQSFQEKEKLVAWKNQAGHAKRARPNASGSASSFVAQPAPVSPNQPSATAV
ncbi:hypothetical protein RMATCC62417_16946 [Rhizopus microsporus]|nr:hypothetical protein RMATCC62417_16946 [Rhizopus microsporus]